MPRDRDRPGTVSIDVCGLEDGRVFLDRSLPTSEALARSVELVDLLHEAHRDAPLDLVVGPSGYGLPLTAARDLTETDLRLAYLARRRRIRRHRWTPNAHAGRLRAPRPRQSSSRRVSYTSRRCQRTAR